eukprot:CAMPEP_0119103912 /NCGR_PEP_ID=MMETSP1180-20130426/2257_1 /TAXON_ID=3052 ORGANISM="Chlamydomonas cf sp, Strain CCMP681" /NCGR_SAMPLE_ID=MMETSP1180 /ASSEMBLY_ACC=CAM_ASM_000741 /LENGTH=78 /DNA_ID=CAMNT_0007088529 /DNA_START=261 /DNA_END=497 /DNA_ORIENTATION=+
MTWNPEPPGGLWFVWQSRRVTKGPLGSHLAATNDTSRVTNDTSGVTKDTLGVTNDTSGVTKDTSGVTKDTDWLSLVIP